MSNNDKYSIYFQLYCCPLPLCSLGEEGASGRLISRLSAATQRQAEHEAQASASQLKALRITQAGFLAHSSLLPLPPFTILGVPVPFPLVDIGVL